MRFDDRLGTVLRHEPSGAASARTQFRQLLDLLGTLPSDAQGESVDRAYLRVASLAEGIPPFEQAEMLEDPGLRLRSPRLIAHLAGAHPAVAAAAIRRAQLGETQWLDLIPALPVRARGFLRLREGLEAEAARLLETLGVHDRALPPAQIAQSAAEPSAADGIAALVKRIEAFRKTRQPGEPANDRSLAPRLPLGEETPRPQREVQAFDFTCDGEGRITWSDPGTAPMVVGRDLLDAEGLASRSLSEAIRRLQPIRAARVRLAGAPAIAGEWQVDAAPWFDPVGGRLVGWRGRFRRVPEPCALPVPTNNPEADRIRQLLHELRTPVNAIQGYAEAMQQGLFGPIQHEYRALSAAIAADAARILAGFEELERLARLESGAMDLEAGETDFAAVVRATINQLEAHTAARDSGFEIDIEPGPMAVPLAAIEAERIVWRLLATVAGAAAPGERLRLRLNQRDGTVRLRLQLPAALAERSDEELFRAGVTGTATPVSAGSFGAGFALRLTAVEARAAGGGLEHRRDKLRLTLAGLTAPTAIHSEHGRATGSGAA
jgi:signal transduction histidine kinase